MHLVLDLGNTNRKAAVFDNDTLVGITSYTEITTGVIETLFHKFPGIRASILSSVINHPPELEHSLREKSFCVVLDENTPVPLKNNYQSPETLGRDRLAAAVAACTLFPGKDVLVINMGTCITYDFADQTGTYQGGSISPGMQMRFRALHTFTGKLPLIDYRENVLLTGKTTEESILAGVISGMTAELEGIVSRYNAIYPELQVILSGGDLNNFDKQLKISTFAVPNIVILGLQKILAFNARQIV